MSELKQLAIVQTQSKSLAVGLLLTLFFGGFGMLYIGIGWGLVGIAIEFALGLLLIISAGFGIFLLVPWHILAAIITVVCINSHNKKLLASLD